MSRKLTSYRLSDFEGKDKTNFIKYQLMKYLRFQRGFTFCVDESINHSDIVGLNDTNLIEIEVKISKSDFLKEFDGKSRIKSYKHSVIQSLWESKDVKLKRGYILPNYFYFCVTPELKQFVLDFMKERCYNYGVLVCEEKRIPYTQTHIQCVKTPKKIQSGVPDNKTFKKIGQRIQSKLITLIEQNISNINSKTTQRSKNVGKKKK